MAVTFSQEIFDRICDRIVEGESLRAICRDDDMPNYVTVFRWLGADEDEAGNDGPLRKQYARAREASGDADADGVKDYGEQAAKGLIDPAAARVAIDALKWSAGKRKPKVYGDKLDVTTDGNPLSTMADEQLLSRAAAIQAALKSNDGG